MGVWRATELSKKRRALGAPINATNQTDFFTELGGGISDVLHFIYTQDASGFGHLDGFVMSDAGEAGIDPAFLASHSIVATLTIGETEQFNFSNTNITALFRSDPADVPEPASLGLLLLGGLGLLLHRRKSI